MRIARSVLALAASAAVATAGGAAAEETRLGADTRIGLTVTVYGDGLGVVSDRRVLELRQGGSRLAFADVSREMVPSSAVLRAADGVRIAEVGYDFDLVTPEALLRRSVGRDVEVVRTHPTTGEDSVESATLLGAEGGVVLRYRDRVEIGLPGRLVFRDLPADLRPLPTLVASVDSDAAGRRELDLGYLTEGLSWQADYAIEIDEANGRLDLAGRATVTNLTGTDFPDATLGLVAGRVNRVAAPEPRPQHRMMAMAAVAADAAMPAREAVGDLHLYTLDRPASIGDRQTRQFALLAAAGVAFGREYVSEAGGPVFGRQPGPPRPTHPRVVLRFANAAADGAGVPLPAGVARVFARDGAGQLRLLGEDRLDDTPVGGEVTLSPGEAFDITVRRLQTDFVRAGLPEGVFESAYRLEVANAKPVAVTVTLVEAVSGQATVLQESAPHEPEAADRLVWRLPVAAGGSAVLTYRVRVQR
ncbi:MAG: DUF4139 domain-containing protein [Rhodospirillales bacterium]